MVWYLSKRFAQRRGCTESMLRKWIHQGNVPFGKVGRLTRIRLADLKAWIRLGLQPV